MADIPFAPSYGQGQIVAATNPAAEVVVRQDDPQVCVTNLGANLAYVRAAPIGNASAADMPVPPGTMIVITKGTTQDCKRVSYFAAAATQLHIITGNGW